MSAPETSLAARPDRLGDVQRLGKLLVASGYFGDAQEMAQAAVKVMAGEELGVPPIASMMGINVIKGKIAMGGNLIATRIRAHGYDYKITRHDNTGCKIDFFGKPNVAGERELLGDSEFTDKDAKAAKVFGDMYQKYPRNMYFNRAISNGAKWHTPDVFAGMPVYVPEELGAEVDGDGNVIETKQPKRKEKLYGTGETKDEIVERRLKEIGGAVEVARPAPVEGGDTGEVVTKEQLKRFWAVAREKNWTQDGVKMLLESLGYTTSKDLTVSRCDELCDRYFPSESERQWRGCLGLKPDDFTQPEQNDLTVMLMQDGTITGNDTAVAEFAGFLAGYRGTKDSLMEQAARVVTEIGESRNILELQQADAEAVAAKVGVTG